MNGACSTRVRTKREEEKGKEEEKEEGRVDGNDDDNEVENEDKNDVDNDVGILSVGRTAVADDSIAVCCANVVGDVVVCVCGVNGRSATMFGAAVGVTDFVIANCVALVGAFFVVVFLRRTNGGVHLHKKTGFIQSL